MKAKIIKEYEVKILDEDNSRCLAKDWGENCCPQLYKNSGEYFCQIFEKSVENEGDDDILGYDFKRCNGCLKEVVILNNI